MFGKFYSELFERIQQMFDKSRAIIEARLDNCIAANDGVKVLHNTTVNGNVNLNDTSDCPDHPINTIPRDSVFSTKRLNTDNIPMRLSVRCKAYETPNITRSYSSAQLITVEMFRHNEPLRRFSNVKCLSFFGMVIRIYGAHRVYGHNDSIGIFGCVTLRRQSAHKQTVLSSGHFAIYSNGTRNLSLYYHHPFLDNP